jgi:thiamine transport system substrate-binding protein
MIQLSGRPFTLLFAAGVAIAASSCGGDDDPTVTLITHDSFFVTEGVFDSFTAASGITVEVLSAGDAGEVVSRAVLTAGAPEGDVLFGIDNTFMQRGLDAELFVPYTSALLDTVPADLQLDSEHRLTPIDFGDVCVNYWTDALPGDIPTSLEDLTLPENASSFVTENPETSSPGFAFLLATIATYGDDWEDYWQRLAEGGVTIEAGWSEAYYEEFAAGGGEKSIVTSYATSPVAEVLFADPPIVTAPTGVILDSCFRQIEFAGILDGTDQPEAAAELIDFMLSPTFQADIPLNMFVAPANQLVDLPAEFVEHGVTVENPLVLSPSEIEENRLEWTERWSEIVLG